MKEINPELVKNLYAKYSPETDVESKMAYIQEKYGDNQDEFVRNFYAKYDPNVDVDSKIEYINKVYTVKKKGDSEATSQVEGTVLPTEQVVEEPISVESSVPVSSQPEVYNLPEGGINTEAIQKTIDESNLGFTPGQIDASDKQVEATGKLETERKNKDDLLRASVKEFVPRDEKDYLDIVLPKAPEYNPEDEFSNDRIAIWKSETPKWIQNGEKPVTREQVQELREYGGEYNLDENLLPREAASDINLKETLELPEDAAKKQQLISGINEKIYTVTDEEREAKQFEIDALKAEIPEGYEGQIPLEFIQQTSKDPFERAIITITPEMIDEKSEEANVAQLNKLFNQYGFSFEETSVGESLKGYSKNGKEVYVDIDTWFSDKGEAKELKSFLEDNRIDNEVILEKENKFYQKSNEKVQTIIDEKDLLKRQNGINTDLEQFKDDYSKTLNLAAELKEMNSSDQGYNEKSIEFLSLMSKVKESKESIKQTQSDLNKLTGEYLEWEEEKWDVKSIVAQSLIEGVVDIGTGVADFGLSVAGVAAYYSGYEGTGISDARDRLYKGKAAITKDLEWFGSTEAAISAIEEDSFIGGALIGTVKSLPSMALGAPWLRGAGGVMSASMRVGIAQGAMTFSAIEEEFRGMEGYADLTEAEKLAVKLPAAIISGLLEKVGFESMFKNKGFMNKVLSDAFNKIPKNADALLIKQTLEKTALEAVKEFSKKTGKAAAGEFLTGASQEVSDITIKSLYNTIKNSEVAMFKTPESLVDGAFQVLKAGGQEAIGGFAMSAPGAVVSAFNTGKGMDLPDGIFEMFDKVSKDDNFNSLFVSSLKTKIAKKEITKSEAQKQLDDYRELGSVMKEIPNDYTNDQKKEAIGLIQDKKAIEKSIDGISPDLVIQQRKDLDEIAEKMKAISSKTDSEYAAEKIQRLESKKAKILESNPEQLKMPIKKGSEITVEQAIDSDITETKKRLEKPVTLKEKAVSLMDRAKGVFTKTETPVQPEMEVGLAPETTEATQTTEVEAEVQVEPKTTAEVEAEVESEVVAEDVVYEMNKTNRKTWSKDFEIIDNRNGLELGPVEENGKWVVRNKVTGDMVNVQTKKDAQNIIANAPAYAEMFGDGAKVEADMLITPLTKTIAEVEMLNLEIDTFIASFEAEVQPATETTAEVEVKKPVSKKIEKKPVESEAEKKEMSTDEESDFLINLLTGKQETKKEAAKVPKKEIDAQVENAKKALSKVAPGVEIIVSESEAEYKKATKEGRNQNSGGTYVDGKIYINPARANKRTVAHEVFHALLLSKGRTDQQAQAITERMMEAVKKNADQELLDRLEKFSSDYENALQSEESIAELMGILADGYPNLNTESKSLIKNWLKRLAKIFGIKPLTSDADIINFLNTVSGKIASGKKIKSRDVQILNGNVSGVINGNQRKQKSILTSFKLKRFPTNPNIKLSEDVPLSTFNNKKSNLLESDRMTGAFISDSNNNPAFKFFGGIYFPQITGKWWASRTISKANSIADSMNANRDKDGYIYATPIIMKPNSHMSNQDMFETVWEFMKVDLRSKSNKVTKDLLQQYLTKALKLKSVNLTESDLKVNKSDSLEAMIKKLDNFLIGENNTLSFEKRKSIIKSILGDPKATEERKFPTAGSISEVATKFEEEKTKQATKLWDIVMIMRTKGNLSAKVTPKSDEFYHKSYPSEISSDKEIEVFFLDGAYNIDATYPKLTKSSGGEFSWKEYSERHPSAAFALSQYGRTAKLSKASGDIVAEPQSRKQKSKDKYPSMEDVSVEEMTDMLDAVEANGVNYKKTKKIPDVISGGKVNKPLLGGIIMYEAPRKLLFSSAESVTEATEFLKELNTKLNDDLLGNTVKVLESNVSYLDKSSEITKETITKLKEVNKDSSSSLEEKTNAQSDAISAQSLRVQAGTLMSNMIKKTYNAIWSKYVSESSDSKILLSPKASQSRQQKSDRPSIAEVRRIAKENGLKEESVQKALKKLGYTDAEITGKKKVAKPKVKTKRPTGNQPKSFSNRAFLSEGINERSRKKLEELGLDYTVESQSLAQKNAEKIIEEIGIEQAYKLAKEGQIRGGARTWIKAQMFEELNERAVNASVNGDTELAEALSDELALIMDEFSDEQKMAGQEAAMLNRIYQNFNMKYDVKMAKKSWKRMFGKDMPTDVEARLKAQEKKINELNEKNKELEKKIGSLEEQEAVENLKENVRRGKKGKSSESSLKNAAELLRKAKFTNSISKLSQLNSSAAGLLTAAWDGAVEAVAITLEKSGSIEQAVKSGISSIKSSDWYKGLSKKNKKIAEKRVENDFNEFLKRKVFENDIKVSEEGDIDIDPKFLYELVESGIDNINDLTEAVYDKISDKYPGITKREVRDAITKYGKQSKETKDEILLKINKIRTDGKQISAIEDLLLGKRPKRSNKPRVITDEQRERIRQIRELLKELPEDDSVDKSRFYKTALEGYKKRVKNRITDLENAIKKNERIVKEKRSLKLDQETKDLIKRKEELQKEYDSTFGKTPKSDETILREIVNRKEKTLRDLEVRLESVKQEGKDMPKSKKKELSNDEIERLNSEIKQKREELNDALEETGVAEAKRIERMKSYSKKRIAELRDKIARKDFSKRSPKKVKYDKELIAIKKKLIEEKVKFDMAFEKQQFKEMGILGKIGEYIYRAFGTFKGLKATADLSAMLRQGILLGSANPKEFAKATAKMHKFAFSSKKYKDFMAELEASDDYINMIEDGVSVTDTSGDVLRSEERFVGNIIQNIPLFGSITKGSERAYGGFLNVLRTSVYRKIVKAHEDMGITREKNPKAYKNIAKFVNNATGRGAITSDRRFAKLLNAVFFSPRMISGMVGLVGDLGRKDSTPYLKKQAAKSLLTFVGYQTAMKYMIMSAAMLLLGDDEDDFEMEMNPTSTDFNKLKKFDTRYDVSAGWGIAVRTLARFILNEKSSGPDAEIKSFDELRTQNRYKEVGNFLFNKLSPLARQIYNITEGNHPSKFMETNEDATAMDYIKAFAVPLTITEMMEGIDEGKPSSELAFNTLLTIYGVGVQTYETSSSGVNKAPEAPKAPKAPKAKAPKAKAPKM